MRPPSFSYPRAEIEARVLGLLEAGWTTDRVAAEPGLPSRQTLYRWAKADAAFATRLAWARDWGRGVRRAGALASDGFDEARAEAFLLAVRRGQAVRDLVRRPEGPNRRVLDGWKRLRPDFAVRLAQAARVAHRLRPPPWPFDAAVADALVLRVSRGEELRAIEMEAAMPGRAAVDRWRRTRPEFAAALKAASLAGHRVRMRQRRRSTPELTDAIAAHILAGGSLRSASLTPGAPHRVTLYGWMRTRPEFARAMRLAAMLRDDRLMDAAVTAAAESRPASVAADRAAVAAIRKRVGQLNGGRKAAAPPRP